MMKEEELQQAPTNFAHEVLALPKICSIEE
jgi:hypothetical protein